jgi:hypothetical protein
MNALQDFQHLALRIAASSATIKDAVIIPAAITKNLALLSIEIKY